MTGTVRRARLLRRDRRSGLQADLPGAAGPGPRRGPGRADRRRRQVRLEPRPVEGTREGQSAHHGPVDQRRTATSCCRCCATSTATMPIPRPSRRCTSELGEAEAPAALSGDSAQHVRHRRGGARRIRLRQDARLVIEKPFGHDRASAQALNAMLRAVLSRKRTSSASTITSARSRCRTSSTPASPIRCSSRSGTATMSRSIQITMAEDFGVQDRGGVLRRDRRDPRCGAEPSAAGARQPHDGPADRRGARGDARPEGRAAEGGPAARRRPMSCAANIAATAPFPACTRARRSRPIVAVRLSIDSWRWAGVPIYIRAGKHLPVTATEVIVQFRRPPREMFGELVPTAIGRMRFRLGPDWRSAWACG